MSIAVEAVPYEKSVFINCPFDRSYLPLFHALIFAVQDCGFHARCAQDEDDSGDVRIGKIKRIIRECQYGIHDISSVQLDAETNLPRFNMPLELGLFLGAQEFGDSVQLKKQSLVLDSEPSRYRIFCSDIAGQDIRAHSDQPVKAIASVRAMLATAMRGVVRVPGETVINARYQEFRSELPRICQKLHVEPAELQFVELRSLIEEWVFNHPLTENLHATPLLPTSAKQD
jgi:hypothetical protein